MSKIIKLLCNFYFAPFHKSNSQELKYLLGKEPDEDKIKL